MTPPPPDEAELVIDARGHRCPVPTLRLRRALEGAARGAQITLLADDPMASVDVPYFAAEAGLEIVELSHDGALTIARVRIPDEPKAPSTTVGGSPPP